MKEEFEFSAGNDFFKTPGRNLSPGAEKFLSKVIDRFSASRNPDNARQMKAYMRDKFAFFGIRSPDRKKLQREILQTCGMPRIDEIPGICYYLWNIPEREAQYFAMDILDRSIKKMPGESIQLLEKLVIHKSWWDTIDGLAANIIGKYFTLFPEQIIPVTRSWMDSGNIWLQRSCLLFQLRYRQDTDLPLMYSFIEELTSHDDFFIRKAIGWVLREYSKTDPEEVIRYVNTVTLNPLSRKEALKVIERKK